MGIANVTKINLFIPPTLIARSAGTWTAGISSNVISEARGAADASFGLYIPVHLPSSEAYRQGAYLESVDVYYKIATAAADDFATVELEKVSLPANGVAVSGSSVATSCDSAHDTAAERKALGDHSLTVTLDQAVWIDDGDCYWLYLLVDAAATTVFTLFGARANFDLRI